jgi:hypothetical protein
LRGVKAMRDAWLSHELVAREAWAEAREILESIDRTLLLHNSRALALVDLSLATTLGGAPEQGLVLAERAVTEFDAGMHPKADAWIRSYAKDARVIALSNCGSHEEALEAGFGSGQPDLAVPGRFRAIRFYFEAESALACGRPEEQHARPIFAFGERSGGPFAPRCAERLAKLAPRHYN